MSLPITLSLPRSHETVRLPMNPKVVFITRVLLASLLALTLIVAWKNRHHLTLLPGLQPPPPVAATSATGLEFAVQNLSPQDLNRIAPQWQGRPTMLEFTAKLCKDCQHMKPDMERLAKQYQGRVETVVVDVEDPPEPLGPVLLSRFAPLVTPTIILISPTLQVTQVLVGRQEPAKLEGLYQQFLRPAAPLPSSTSSSSGASHA
jgi:thiol-disulfide isomerase/thioredoxin